MQFRDYDRQRDRDAAIRVFREVGWITDTKHEEAADEIFGSGRTMVAEVEGSVECVVTSDPGTMCYLDEDLRLAAVTGVTTSRVARKRGLAGQLTARLLAEEARDGAHVAVLGIFEQGYYNQLGFGNGSYEHWYTFDPALLLVTSEPRIPVRLGPHDWKAMHENRLRRVRAHGSCSLTPASMTKAEVLWSDNGFGLGYRDDQGDLSHHFWCTAKETEHGPNTVLWMAYRTKDEFHELLALLKSLGE
ncbi:GNAT family N-acetyltransferase, partial [Candidatus Bipolaricaulota bacterium]|nr:GNAT family N-acetyltransferase [Candidatus Bipolaricaulota bacterium]